MTVFKTFLKVLYQCKIPIIMYTIFLLFFSIFQTQTNENTTNFIATKPDVFIVNHDQNIGLTEHFIQYIEENCNIINIASTENAIDDALFYRDVNYVIYIPPHFREDFLNHKNPQIEIKSTGDYQASLAEMLVSRYLKTATIYNLADISEKSLLIYITNVLTKKADIQITSQLDSNSLSNVASYYNFMNYCILAGCIYVICIILSSFKNNQIKKRTIISSMNYRKYNRYLLFSNGLFAFLLWFFYILLSFFLFRKVMFTLHGIFYIINSFLFSFCTLTIAFLIGNVVQKKEALNGIVNVIALGSSFICGSFVPLEWLPKSVLSLAHFFPSYWYIKNNEILKTIETFQISTLKPILINMSMIILFSILFIGITNFISFIRRKNS